MAMDGFAGYRRRGNRGARCSHTRRPVACEINDIGIEHNLAPKTGWTDYRGPASAFVLDRTGIVPGAHVLFDVTVPIESLLIATPIPTPLVSA